MDLRPVACLQLMSSLIPQEAEGDVCKVKTSEF